jgi:hypothetical protein
MEADEAYLPTCPFTLAGTHVLKHNVVNGFGALIRAFREKGMQEIHVKL